MKTVALIGFGVEGRAAARHFLSGGDHVIALDDKAIAQPRPEEFAGQDRFEWLGAEGASDIFSRADIVLRSPGIPPTHPVLLQALAAGHHVTTPTGYWITNFSSEHALTVTGTKGKSTTVSLAVSLLQSMGHEAVALGNIGLPPLDTETTAARFPVLELSSYMLHDIPDGSYTHLVTNLYREHTPWHGTEDAYYEAKLRPFRFSLPRPGATLQETANKFSLPDTVETIENISPLRNDHLLLGNEQLPLSSLAETFREGPHLSCLRNAIAGVAMLIQSPPSADIVADVVNSYQGLPSRQEIVPSKDGRRWVNDALATIPEAVIHALSRFRQDHVHLLLGGADRGQNFTALASTISSTPNIIPLVFGSIAEKLDRVFTDQDIPFHRCESYEDALSLAARVAPKGSVILFSPAAASEAPHANYVERADIFRTAAASA